MRFLFAHSRLLAIAGLAVLLSVLCSCGGSGGSGNTPPPEQAGYNPITLTKDNAGWTVFTPAADSRIIYVSTSGDNATAQAYTPGDAAIGADPFHPVGTIKPFATFAAARLVARDGYPDWILFKRGDAFSGVSINPKSGRSATEFALISSYGTGPLPVLKPAAGSSMLVRASTGNSLAYFAFTNLDCYAAAHDPSSGEYDPVESKVASGFSLLTDTGTIRQVLLEGVRFRFFRLNDMQVYGATGTIKEIAIRRCAMLDTYQDAGHSQGFYAHKVTGLLLEECVLDHNGWYQQNDGTSTVLVGEATMFNHNTYFSGCHNITFRNNIFLRGSSMNNKFTANDGAASASNIVLQGNLYLDGEIGIGIGGNVNTPYKFKNISITDNVFTEIGRSQPTGRTLGWGIEIADWDGGTVQRNYFLHNTTPTVRNTFGMSITGGTRDVTISDNVIYNQNATGTNGTSYGLYLANRDTKSNIVVRSNLIQEPVNPLYLANLQAPADAGGYLFSGNRYYLPDSAASRAFLINNANSTFAAWALLLNDSSLFGAIAFAQPTRSIATYQASLGATATIDAFIAACRAQSRVNWDSRYTAPTVTAWLKAGFTY